MEWREIDRTEKIIGWSEEQQDGMESNRQDLKVTGWSEEQQDGMERNRQDLKVTGQSQEQWNGEQQIGLKSNRMERGAMEWRAIDRT